MAAEVVVIVENENAGLWASLFAVEVSGRQAADAAAHDNQIVRLACVCWISGGFPKSPIAQGVGDVKGAGLTASHTRERRGIRSRRRMTLT